MYAIYVAHIFSVPMSITHKLYKPSMLLLLLLAVNVVRAMDFRHCFRCNTSNIIMAVYWP